MYNKYEEFNINISHDQEVTMLKVTTTTYSPVRTYEERTSYCVTKAELRGQAQEHCDDVHAKVDEFLGVAEVHTTVSEDAKCPIVVFWPDGLTTYVYVNGL